jgi:catechol 2,3-dioxygenase-like lactoylglutathione lyase family enzyme
MSYDPDGVILDVFELVTSPDSLLADYDGKCSGLQTVALHASDARVTARFYAALGFRPWYDKLLENMEDFFHLPKGTALHNINLVMPDATIGRIEVAQYVGWEGESLRHRAVPPNIGILSISLETDDLDATDALLTTIGAERCSDSVEVSLEPFGSARASSWFGPDGELLELYQRL